MNKRIFICLMLFVLIAPFSFAEDKGQMPSILGTIPEAPLQEKQTGFSVSGHLTYVDFSGSDLKNSTFSETLKFSYNPNLNFGGDFYIKQGVITRRKASVNGYYDAVIAPQYPVGSPQRNGSQVTPYNNHDLKLNASVFKFFDMGDKGFLGFRADGSYIFSNDSLSADTFIPYISLMYKTPDQSKYFDIGYAYSRYAGPVSYRDPGSWPQPFTNYDVQTASQFTATYGMSLFNWKAWSQTRFYYIAVNDVQNRDRNYAVEQKFTYFIVPQKFDVTFSMIFGNRQYAYDVDLKLPYDSGDVQNSSFGISTNYNFTKKLSMYADITRETYSARGIWGFTNDPWALNNNYIAMYYTLGMRYAF